MNNAYLLMGGNVGDTNTAFQRATELLQAECGPIIQLSRVYKTAPWGKKDQQSFLNQAFFLTTSLSAQDLMTGILGIEEKMGRQRLVKYGPRIIDIDILLFNGDVIDDSLVTIPHPQLPFRRFALVPLAEIAPIVIHPVLNKTILELLSDCPDQLDVSLLE